MIVKLMIWLMVTLAPLSGLRDERIYSALAPKEGQTYLGNVSRLFLHSPEAARFILEYPFCYGADIRIDLSKEVTKGEIPLFLQWDKRWGYQTYGSSFLAMTGCGPTCLAMVYCGLTGDIRQNPYRIACMAMENGYYVPGVGTAWELFTTGAEALGLEVQEVYFDEGYMAKLLADGMPIICSMRPGDFTNAGHFIVLTGIDQNRAVGVRDPNSRSKSERTWELSRVFPQIKGMWAYRCSGL